MSGDRHRAGTLLALSGAALLAVSVFAPWYALTLTANGVAAAQQGLNNAAQQFGNSAFQGLTASLGSSFSGLVGRHIGTLNGHQASKVISILVLIFAAAAFVAALLRLARPEDPSGGARQIAGVGLMAAMCVVFRMVERPLPQDGVFAVSLSWGIWLSLASCVAIVAGSLWSGSARAHRPRPSFRSWLAGY